MDAPSLPPTPQPAVDPSNDKLLAVLCHISPFLGLPFILPLIVYLVKRGESPVVEAHAKEVLNFHISLLIYSICAIPLIFFLIGIPVLFALALLSFICSIIATIRASEGGFFFYPLTIRFIT